MPRIPMKGKITGVLCGDITYMYGFIIRLEFNVCTQINGKAFKGKPGTCLEFYKITKKSIRLFFYFILIYFMLHLPTKIS